MGKGWGGEEGEEGLLGRITGKGYMLRAGEGGVKRGVNGRVMGKR